MIEAARMLGTNPHDLQRPWLGRALYEVDDPERCIREIERVFWITHYHIIDPQTEQIEYVILLTGGYDAIYTIDEYLEAIADADSANLSEADRVLMS
jgi:hypothetical protein